MESRFVRNASLKVDPFVLTTVKTSTSMDENGREKLWLMVSTQHSVESTIGA